MELLVAISIISVLLALGIPAVQSAREASRKNTCLNHGRQIGLAAQLHHAAFRSLPSNGGFTENSMIADINGRPTYVSTESFSTGSASRWGIGAPGLSPKVQSGCWAYALLPFLEQQAAYETVSVHTNQPIYTCVSRPSRPTLSPAEDQFGRYVTGNIPWARTDFAANRKVVTNRPRVTEIPHIRDGTSHTIFAGEKSIDPVLHGTGSWYFDEPIFTGGSHGTARDGNRVIQDRVGTAAILNWGSTHPGGAVFVMIDGSTHSVGYSIDRKLVSALVDPNDGKTKTLSDYFGH